MRIIKIIVGSLAALWALGILLKLIRNFPVLFNDGLGPSRLLGALAGLIIMGLISYVCFKGAFGANTNKTNPPQT